MVSSTTFALHTLGCKLNYAESSALARQLTKAGLHEKPFNEPADIYVLNTCSVTDSADAECMRIIRRVHAQNPAAFVVVTGCMAQLRPQELARMEGVHLVLGADEKFNLAHHITRIAQVQTQAHSCDIQDVNNFVPAYSSGEKRARAFLKVQDGCDYACSYCIIPQARGKSRSAHVAEILAQADELARAGVQEIVLTGVNIGDFGARNKKHILGEARLIDLLRALDEKSSVPRFRISSIEPNLLSDEVIDFVAASARFMPHFHVPLQSGSDKILSLMRRRYRRADYEKRVHYIKKKLPDCAIGVDVIVGFPNESEEDFLDTYHFLDALPISYLHVFTYSERKGTPAAEMPAGVEMHKRKMRNTKLRALSEKKMKDFSASFIGTRRAVLFENPRPQGTIEGYTDNYIRVVAGYKQGMENTIIDWDFR